MNGSMKNGIAFAELLRELHEAYDSLNDNPYEIVEADGREFDDLDVLVEHLHEVPLSVEVRSGWVSVGQDLEPDEYNVTVTTGGPACRVVGNVDVDGQPGDAEIQVQDWGVPWTRVSLSDEQHDALDWFVENVLMT